MLVVRDLMVNVIPENIGPIMACTAATCTCTPTTHIIDKNGDVNTIKNNEELSHLKIALQTSLSN